MGECRDPAALEADYPRAGRGTDTGNSAQNPRGSRPEILQTTESSAGLSSKHRNHIPKLFCHTLSYGRKQVHVTEYFPLFLTEKKTQFASILNNFP